LKDDAGIEAALQSEEKGKEQDKEGKGEKILSH